jgi:hypothetical protein
MRPAFPKKRSAAGFLVLLATLLLLPRLVPRSWLRSREQAYDTQGWSWSAYPWIRNQIFEETNDIDVAFIGSSHIFYDIDAPYVQGRLSEKLGRPAVVRMLGWAGGGFDALYFITRDLLEHRRVKVLVFYDEAIFRGLGRNRNTPFWFRWHDDGKLISSLPIQDQAYYYYAAILGMPRNLLGRLRPNQPAPLEPRRELNWFVDNQAPNPATRLGSFSAHVGNRPSLDRKHGPFEPFAPAISPDPNAAVVYSSATQTDFEFDSAPLPEWQARFAQLFGELTQKYGVKPVMIDLPHMADFHLPVIHEQEFWPKMFPGGIILLGAPESKTFGSLNEADLSKLMWDPSHLNANGQMYFTRFITPALLKLYDTQTAN